MNTEFLFRTGSRTPVRWMLSSVLAAGAILGVVQPADAGNRMLAPMANSNAEFVTWQQGFEHDTAGWYDANTDGPLGWCGAIEHVSGRGLGGAVPAPSAGRGYATVEIGLCNPFWSTMGVAFGAPYGPGPDQVLYSGAWPEAGYVTELDIYLDPAWSGLYQGNFAWANSSSESIIQYAATVFPTDPDAEPFHTGPHYFVEVSAVPGEAALDVAGERIEEAGWCSFRYVFSNVAGEIWVDFELAERSGGTIVTVEGLNPIELLGPFKVPYAGELPTAGYGSGHAWFFDVAGGLKLPIDEHRVRRGR